MTERRRGRARLAPGPWTERDLLAGEAPDAPDLRAIGQAILARLRPGAPTFEPGDLLIVGPGFGAHTTTDWVALALAAVGVGAVVAPSMDRPLWEAFLRAGVPVLLTHGLRGAVDEGDDLTVDLDHGTVENVRRRRMLMGTPLGTWERDLVRTAPSRALYGAAVAVDPDVLETRRVH